MPSPRIEITRTLVVKQTVSLDSYQDDWTTDQAINYEMTLDDIEAIQYAIEAAEVAKKDELTVSTLCRVVD